MMLLSILAAFALQATPADTTRAARIAVDAPSVALDSATLAGAYADAGARDLVERARARRRAVDRSIAAYETVAREHMSVRLRAGWLERMIYRRDMATRIHWRRDGPTRMEVLGARMVAPVVEDSVAVPGDLDALMRVLGFDPAEQERLIGLSDSSFVRHPLARGSEEYYRFRSGDTTELRLPDGRTVRLIELEVLPRRPSPTIIRGSLWLDTDSHGIVRAAFQLSEDINTVQWNLAFETRITEDSLATDTVTAISIEVQTGAERERLPEEARRDTAEENGDMGFLERSALRLALAMVPDIRARLRYVTIDYGLWDMRWWLPRLVAVEGVVEVAGLEVPVHYERGYGAYRVIADSTPGAAAPPPRAESDSAGNEPELIVSVPDDTASLLTSEYLPSTPFAADARLIEDAELEALLGEVAELSGFEAGAGAPWSFAWSGIDWDPLVRYNRVEALSLGMGVEFDLGPIEVSAAARLGTGDVEPRGALTVVRHGAYARYELAGYRRLETMDPRLGFSNVASASALFFGYDEPDYYDVLGVSLRRRPPGSARQWYEWRIFAQRERAVRKETDFSVPDLFDEDDVFRANPAAMEAVQYGAGLALRTWRGRDPDGLRWGGELRLDAATGDFTYARPSLSLRTTFPLPGSFVGALEAEAGAVRGEAARQHLRRVGGRASVRGYHGSALVGESSWRLRAELATRFPAARLILFSDAGWAGPFAAFGEGDPLVSAGLGAGFLDGFIRVDLARALVAPVGWRLALYVNGAL